MENANHCSRENLLKALNLETPERVPDGLEEVFWARPPVIERPKEEGFDSFGCHWSLEKMAEGGSYPTHGMEPVKDLGRWRELVRFPDPGAFDWSETKKAAEEARREGKLVMGFVEMGLLERACLLLGMEQALMAFLTEPELMDEMVSATASYKIKLIERMHKEARPDMIWYGDDWGSQKALLLPPETWRKIVKPHTKRIYDCVARLGMKLNQHSCGMIEEVFGDMVEMGAKIWNPCQPCNDLRKLKSLYGRRIAFCGGIDSQFVLAKPGVTAAEVRAEVRKRIDEMAEGGGYVAAPSHGVPYSPEILEAMHGEIASYGSAFYALSREARLSGAGS